MEKLGFKPSKDPAHNAIRQNKAVLNKSISEFIDDLIQYKKLMNGWSSKFHNEKSFLTNPIPADPATIIGSLAGDFQEIAREAVKIIEQQRSYAESRPKKTSSSDELFLIKRSSNPFSRAIGKLYFPFGSRAVEHRYRVSLVNLFTTVKQDLFDLEGFILSTDKNALYKSEKLFKKIVNDIRNSRKIYEQYKSHLAVPPKEDEGESGADTDSDKKHKPSAGSTVVERQIAKTISEAYECKKDFAQTLNLDQKFEIELLKKFREKIKNVGIRGSKKIESENDAINLIELYKEMLSFAEEYYSKELNKKMSFSSFADVVDTIGGQVRAATSAMIDVNIKLADNAVNKFLKKIRHQLLPGSYGATRLEAYEKAKQLRSETNKLLDSLEEKLDASNLDNYYNFVFQKLDELDNSISILSNSFISGKYYKDLELDDKDEKYFKDRSRFQEINKMLRKLP